jgi:hypothetical protein
MPIRMFKTLIRGVQDFKYVAEDGKEFFELEEAVEYDNSLRALKPKKVVVYEFISSIQQAINMAVAENRVVRFIWNGDNASIKKGIEDKKGSRLMKPNKESHDVAIVPEGIKDFDFEEVE